MKHILYLLLLISTSAFGQKNQVLSAGELNSDLNYLQKVLLDAHPAPTKYIDGARLAEQFRLSSFDSANTTFELEKRINAILYRIGCAHTILKNSVFESTGNNMPFQFYACDSAVWISEVLHDSVPANYRGCKVLSINTHTAQEMIGKMRTCHAPDGYNQTLGYRVINAGTNFNTLYAYYFDRDSVKQMQLLNRAGDTLSIQVAMVRLSGEKSTKNKPAGKICNHHYFSTDSLNRVAFLDIHSFVTGKGRSGRAFKSVFKQLDEQGTAHLVIDLRNNLGGNIESADRLLSYLIDTNYRYEYRRPKSRLFAYSSATSKGKHMLDFLVGPSSFANKKERTDSMIIIEQKEVYKERKYAYRQNTYVLVNGLTASAAAYAASVMKYRAGAVIIGEETGGGAAGCNGSIQSVIKLPHSKLKVAVPKYHIDFRLTDDRGRGVIPDIYTGYTIEHIMNKTDLEKDKVRELISGQWQTANKTDKE